MSYTAKSVVFDCKDTFVPNTWTYMGIRSVDFWLDGSKITMTSGFTAYSTTQINATGAPDNMFDTSLSKTGAYTDNSWVSTARADVTNADQRVIIVFDTPLEFDAIKVNNFHSNGAFTYGGAESVVITISDDEITSTTFEDTITNATVIFDGDFTEHTNSNTEDEETLTLIEPAAPESYELELTIAAQSSTLTDFPVTIVLGDSSGIGDLDTSDVLTQLPLTSVTAKSVVFDIAHNAQAAKMARSVEFKLDGVLIAVGDGVSFTVYGNEYSTDYGVDNLFDTTLSKIGAHSNNGWQYNSTNPERLVIVFDTAQEFDEIVFNNHHDNGTSTEYGLTAMAITMSTDAITSTTYQEAITNPTVLFDGAVDFHVSSNIIDDQIIFEGVPQYNLITIKQGETTLPVEVETWIYEDADETSYPPAHSGTYVIASSNVPTSYLPYFATDPAKSLTGTYLNNAWVSNTGNDTEQKFNIDYGTAFVAKQIYLENSHHNGASTNIGIKNFVLYGTNDATAFANTTYSNTDDLTLLGTYLADEHTASDVVDPQYFDIADNTTAFRYYVLRIADNYGHADNMGIRHIQIRERIPASAVLHTKATLGTSATVLTLNYDPSNEVNNYIEKTKTSVEVFDETQLPSANAWTADLNWRFVLAAANLTPCKRFKIYFGHNGGDYEVDSCYVQLAAASGDVYDFKETPIQVTFGGSTSTTIEEDTYSDPIDLEIDGTENLVISVLSLASATRPYRSNPTGQSSYYKATATDESATVDATGYSSSTNGRIFQGLHSAPINQEVWDSNFKAVYHMAQDPSGSAPQLLESTSNEMHLTSAGTMLTEDLVDGDVGKGVDFDGSDDTAVSTATHGVSSMSAGLTLFAKIKTTTTADYGRIFELTGTGLALYMRPGGEGIYLGTSGVYSQYAHADINDGNEHTIVGVYDAATQSTAKLYIDGVEITRTSIAGSTATISNSTFRAGDRAASDRPFGGIIYEAGFLVGDMSEDWIATTYLSLTDALITYSFSSPDPPVTGYRKPRHGFPGFPSPYKVTFAFHGFNTGAKNLLPKYPTFGGS